MALVVVSEPDCLLIGDAEVNSGDRSLVPALEFPQPLVGNIKISGDRHGKDAARACSTPAQPRDPVAQNSLDVLFCRQVNKGRHCCCVPPF